MAGDSIRIEHHTVVLASYCQPIWMTIRSEQIENPFKLFGKSCKRIHNPSLVI